MDPSNQNKKQPLKHSSGDLHSRLKTRKLLGVGETDDGDVHRSKLSQILGHSDQLYIKFPTGLRVWQFVLAVFFSLISLWALIFPSHLFDVSFHLVEGHYLTLPVRMYGVALLSLSVVYWSTLQSQDRVMIRLSLLSSIMYFSLQTIVTACAILSLWEYHGNCCMVLAICFTCTAISFYFYWRIFYKLVPIRPAPAGLDPKEQ